jgi:AcrR family transcriptional regulator
VGTRRARCYRWVTKRLLSVANLRHAVNVTTGALAGPAVSATVERLLDAAAGAFADRGFHATTTRDIASRAGLSPAGVYVHFDSKEALLYALSRRGHEAALTLVRGAATGPGTPTERVARVMSGFATWHAEHYQVARVVQYEFPHLLPDHRDEVLGLRKAIDDAVREVLEDGAATGEFEVTDVRDTALALMSLCIDVARWYSPGVRRTPERIGRTYASLGLRLVGAGA